MSKAKRVGLSYRKATSDGPKPPKKRILAENKENFNDNPLPTSSVSPVDVRAIFPSPPSTKDRLLQDRESSINTDYFLVRTVHFLKIANRRYPL